MSEVDIPDNDDNALAEFDLSAWEAPEPPADLADRVIARVTGTAATAGTATALEHEAAPSRRRALFVAGGITAALAAAAAVILTHGANRVAPPHGALAAGTARHLDLDTVTADLDAGASVVWHREPDRLVVAQAGSVRWTVAPENTYGSIQMPRGHL